MNKEIFREFGNTKIKLHPLGFGSGQIGLEHQTDKEIDIFLNSILDTGINLIDTARGYGFSEERIGKSISNRRNEFILSTKVGYDVEGFEDWSYNAVYEGINRALKVMKTDYIDIVHIHSCSLDILQKGDVIEALLKAKENGKIRLAAYSGENAELDFAVKSKIFDSIECSINICDQRVIENQLQACKDNGLGVIAKRPIANAPWRFQERPIGQYVEPYWERFQKMNIQTNGLSFHEIAIRFIGYLDGVSSFIIGTTSLDHFKENLALLEKGPLPKEIIDNITSSFKENDDNWIGQV